MFKKQTSLFFSFLLPLFALWMYQIFFVRCSDFDHLKEILHQKHLTSSTHYPTSDQRRNHVRKDIWFTQDEDTRLHYKITSDSSLLTLIPIGNQFEIIENLEGIQCWMQDRVYENEQQSRFIEAKRGVYCHSTQEFTANDVQLSLFRLPGRELPEHIPTDKDAAFLRGIARDVSFFFGEKTPQFQAKQFQATVIKE